ncbi:hypothetical protein GH811_17735 [Acetobacterium malicum]|uniref:Uncharacterized protein n=1 Tax=Acetobacterium malicum TaxID=52692 RepID=A0ABR6Z1P4_9FIRM|nr:hypothetical protein [Acetobacterium malicum]MBC3901445.1 hypothetical protein [Acetobacterium malicum]
MEKAIKPCSICNGLCDVKTVFEPQKKYCVTCTVCGNETDPKPTRNAAINCHNKTSFKSIKTLL